MNAKCMKEGTPCLHAMCCDVQGVGCCRDCEYMAECATSCFKVRGEAHERDGAN